MNNEPPQALKPQFWHDPNKITFKELYKYTSRDMLKIQQSVRNYKGSMFYIGGILAGCFVAKVFIDGAAKDWIFGENGNGGQFLEMKTLNNDYDMSYNREFQRMRYLTEDPTGSDPFAHTRDQQLIDLGYSWTPLGTNYRAHKKSPHFKYF